MLRKTLFPIFLILFGIAVVAWQRYEHQRFVNGAKAALRHRAQDIANTLAVVIRSQRFFGGVIIQPKLEIALLGLVQSEDLKSIVLFNASGEIVCSAGENIHAQMNDFAETDTIWNENSVTFFNLVNLNIDQRYDFSDAPTIIVSDEERDLLRKLRPPPPSRRNDDRDGPPHFGGRPEKEEINSATFSEVSNSSDTNKDHYAKQNEIDNATASTITNQDKDYRRRRRNFPWKFHRPSHIDEEVYQQLVQKAGLHAFMIEMSTDKFRFIHMKDIWMRISITGFAFLAILGFWFAWRKLIKSSDLQLRLVRASEMNAYLREMNLAAAGLAHETRNPLNLVRGLAQVIAKKEDCNQDIRNQAEKITEEVDCVTAQLNEFINYSRPREPKPIPVDLKSIIQEVERTLITDLEDKNIHLEIEMPEVAVEADEGLLRQIIFNLILNSIQAVDESGSIYVTTIQDKAWEISLIIQDDGPGISVDNHDKIFTPYFTTRSEGTGLGLAVVKQMVSAHGWDIKYITMKERGAKFVITGIKVLSKES